MSSPVVGVCGGQWAQGSGAGGTVLWAAGVPAEQSRCSTPGTPFNDHLAPIHAPHAAAGVLGQDWREREQGGDGMKYGPWEAETQTALGGLVILLAY